MTDDEIVDAFAGLCSARGAEQFLAAPIVRPHADYLPDPWAPTLEATSMLLRRIMHYAGLDLDATLQTYDRSRGAYHHNTIAWFAGIEGERCLFGIDIGELDDPQSLIASLCHEVAHAYRAFHGITVDDRDEEERLTDLTAIFLGFGIFMVNASERFIKEAYQRGTTAVTRYGSKSSGYLTLEESCFAFGVQLTTRNTNARDMKAIAKVLEPDQARVVRLMFEGARAGDLRARLGVSEVPAPFPLARYTQPLSGERWVEVEERHLDPEVSPRINEGRPVFRVREGGFGRRAPAVYFGILLGAIVGFILFAFTDEVLMFAITLPLGIGFTLSRVGRARDVCSGPGCRAAVLPPEATVCENCGGVVKGRIDSLAEHLDAEEALGEFTTPPAS